MNENIHFITVVSSLFILVGIGLFFTASYIDEQQRHIDMLEYNMYFLNKTVHEVKNNQIDIAMYDNVNEVINYDKNPYGVNGLYDSETDIIQVQVYGRDIEKINHTMRHEICHAFIDKDYGHFCGHTMR
jgi:hypothetical protein